MRLDSIIGIQPFFAFASTVKRFQLGKSRDCESISNNNSCCYYIAFLIYFTTTLTTLPFLYFTIFTPFCAVSIF